MADALAELPPSGASPEEALPILPARIELSDPVRETTELSVLGAADLSSEDSAIPTDACSNNASFSSTPPTTLTDAASIASESSKPDLNIINDTLASFDQSEPPEHIEPTVEVGTPHRDLPLPPPKPTASDDNANVTPKRARTARSTTRTPVYNLSKLLGTEKHGKRRANGDDVVDRRRHSTPGDDLAAGSEARAVGSSISASPKSARGIAKAGSVKGKGKVPPVATRRATRAAGLAPTETVIAVASVLGKRSRKSSERVRVPRELQRLQDTNEFRGVEAKPVLHTIWSNGKYIDPNELDESGEPPVPQKTRKSLARKQETVEEEESVEEAAPVIQPPPKRVKKWLSKGLYAGQEAPADYTSGLGAADKKKLAQIPELKPSVKVNKILPLPMFAGLRTLIHGRDFKLPYDVCNPLPPGQPKPDEWRKMTKNRFVGDAGTYWRKTDHFKDYQSKCVCKPDDGCAEDCQNRIMLYECDDTNCNVGKEHCQNRAFQNLTERTKKGGRFRVGVEVLKTSDRGHGVRSNRCFEPNQIIMEYTGEIITEAECERRMNEKYKDNECYYLMAFDQNMIIDATTGSIARFVNHSCDPNCRMEKWIVHGQPRMALFAGEKPIMTGDELTYDYNFDPFSAKNVQKCLCGSANCRGVLGPKVSKIPKAEAKIIKAAVKAATKTGKRNLKALLGDEEGGSPSKKRKIVKAAGAKGSLGTKSAVALKKTANSIAVLTATPPKKPVQSVSVRKATLVKASKVLVKNGKQLMLADTIVSKASMIVSPPKKVASKAAPKKKATVKASPVKSKAKALPVKSKAKALPAKSKAKASPAKSKAKATTKTASKSTIKATIKSAGVKVSVKSAKHTISKTAGKKTMIKKTTRVAKESILASAEEAAPAPAEGGSISVKAPSPRKAPKVPTTKE